MYLTPYQKKQIRYVLVLLLGIPATLFAVYQGFNLLSQAALDPTPKEVVISNVTTLSFSVSWVTEKAVAGDVIPVLNGQEFAPVSDKEGSSKKVTHYVEIGDLKPDTLYSLILRSDGQKYTSGSTGEYKFKTPPVGSDGQVANPLYGTVSGGNASDSIVYLGFKSNTVYPVSAATPSNGGWIIDLSSLRSVADGSLVKATSDTQVVLIARSSSSEGAVIEGTLGSLFDNNGKLNQSYTLSLGSLSNFPSYLPTQSFLGSSQPIVEKEIVEETVTKPTPKPTVTVPKAPVVKTYTIRHDIEWVDLASSSSNLQSGEDTVLITNVSDRKFSVIWRSTEKEAGYIKYGLTSADLDLEARDIRDDLVNMGQYYYHSIEAVTLTPETTYYFEIYSGDEIYDNGGKKYEITTPPVESSAPPYDVRSVTVKNSSDPSDLILVFMIVDGDELGTLGSSQYFSDLPESDGTLNIEIGNSRSSDGSSYFSSSKEDILQVFFLGADEKKFDFDVSEESITLDMGKIQGNTVFDSVQLLSDYGIIKL